ncbi:MAG: alcohol dehydrogenase [Frankiales bacterium]|jgi:alcohol dehydrogenase|nr:alcohol dehydrogenase [Frankiales bacterium]
MKALVFHGPGQRSFESVPDPVVIDDRDVIVRVEAVTICGTDLHILKGDVPEVAPGTILGHEAVGTIVEVGRGVRDRKVGDRVVVSCISACGSCSYCREARYGQCLSGGGWVLGHTIDGVQAELVRVPFGDLSTYVLPAGLDAGTAVLLADILPTAYEVGVLSAGVSPGDTVVIVGAGPVGLAAVATARLYSPANIIVVDREESRLQAAKVLGADITLDAASDVVAAVLEVTGGLGAHVAFEAVGLPETFELCTTVLRPGGRVANIGVHGKPATLHLESLWIKDITITTGLVDTRTTARLLELVTSGQLDVDGIITHRFGFDEMAEAYDVFSRPQDSGALKVVLFR